MIFFNKNFLYTFGCVSRWLSMGYVGAPMRPALSRWLSVTYVLKSIWLKKLFFCCIIVIVYTLYSPFICYLFISNSLFRLYIFRLLLFIFDYLAITISHLFIYYLLFGDLKICRQKNPRYRGGLVVCYEDYYWGGILLTITLFGIFKRGGIFIWSGESRLCNLCPLAPMLIKLTQLLYWIHGERVTLLSYINTICRISHTII